METVDEKREEEARLVYQIYTEDIRHAKNQLWLIIASGLSLQAGLYEFFKDNSFFLNFKYWIVVIATALLMFLLYIYSVILFRYKSKKEKIVKHFEKDIVYILLEADDNKFNKFIGKYSEIIFVILFAIFLIIGAFLICKAI